MLTETVPTTITTTTPPTILPPADASLQELRRLQREWLEAAREAGHLLACRLVARYLGDPFQIRNWPEIEGYNWEAGALSIKLFEKSGRYLPARGDYAHSWSVFVEYNGLKVCFFRESTDPADNQDDPYFIPGSWIQDLQNAQRSAEQRQQDLKDAATEEQRQELLTRLLGL